MFLFCCIVSETQCDGSDKAELGNKEVGQSVAPTILGQEIIKENISFGQTCPGI